MKVASLSPERESDPLPLLNTSRHIFWSSLLELHVQSGTPCPTEMQRQARGQGEGTSERWPRKQQASLPGTGPQTWSHLIIPLRVVAITL